MNTQKPQNSHVESPEKHGKDTLKLFLTKFKNETCIVVFVLFCSGFAELLGIGTILPLIGVIIKGNANNNALSSFIFHAFDTLKIEPKLSNFLLIIVFAIIAKNAIVFSALNYATAVSTKISLQYRNKLISSLMDAQWPYFTRLPIGYISNALSEESTRAGNCYMLSCKALGSFVMILIYLGAAFMVAWQISVFALMLGAVLGYLLKAITRHAQDSSIRMTTAMRELLAQMTDMLIGLKALKSMAKEKEYLEQVHKTTAIVCSTQRRQISSMHVLNGIYEPILVISLSIGMFVTIEYIKTPVTTVIILAFLFYRLMGQANQFQNYYQNMVITQSAVWSLENQIHQAELEHEIIQIKKPGLSLTSAIEIKNICFSYDKNSHLFDNFSAYIPARSITVLFGPSGSGKSTLLDMILGFCIPDKGQICVDDVDLKDSNLKLWRKKIGYVPQETFLFHDTVENNVTLGCTSPNESRIISALEKSGALSFVNGRAEGIKFMVGERGGLLSGGQRQRIALARALYSAPDLLILDEATSGLDAKTEKEIMEILVKLKTQMTILVISHNPTMLSYADHKIEILKSISEMESPSVY